MQPKAPSRASWLALSVAAAALFVTAGVRGSFGAFIVPMQRGLGWDATTISLGVAFNTVAYGFGYSLAGYLVGRYGVRRTMVGCVAVLAASGAALYFVHSPWYFWAVYGVLPGLGFAGASQIPGTELVARHFPSRQVGFATGLLTAALPGGQIVLLPVATLLLGALGFRWAYVALSVLMAGVVIPLVLLTLPRDAPAPRERPRQAVAVREELLDGQFLLLAVGFTACGFSDQMMVVHLIPFAIRSGMAPLGASLLLSLTSAFGLAGSVLIGALMYRGAARHVLSLNYLCRAVSYAFLLSGVSPIRPWMLAVFALLFGLTFMGNQPPAVSVALSHFGPSRTSQVIANLTTIHHLAGAIGIALAGYFADHAGSYAPAFVIAAATLVVASGASLGLRREHPILAASDD